MLWSFKFQSSSTRNPLVASSLCRESGDSTRGANPCIGARCESSAGPPLPLARVTCRNQTALVVRVALGGLSVFFLWCPLAGLQALGRNYSRALQEEENSKWDKTRRSDRTGQIAYAALPFWSIGARGSISSGITCCAGPEIPKPALNSSIHHGASHPIAFIASQSHHPAWLIGCQSSLTNHLRPQCRDTTQRGDSKNSKTAAT